MASVIKAGNATDGVQVTSDNTGILELKTGSGAGTTAMTIGTDQSVTFAGAVSSSGNQTVTGNLTVDGNTTLGNANTDTILMTAAPSIGGAGLGMGFGFRNRIINGAMVIDQRNAGASVTATSGGGYFYSTDRFVTYNLTGVSCTTQRVAEAPAGFINSAKLTFANTFSLTTTGEMTFQQLIEGFNTADLGWGAAGAQSVTVSFWVRSSFTGTFSVGVANDTGIRAYATTYTINAANTWEYKTVTIPGDTSGTWLTNNGAGMLLRFMLASGSNFVVSANNTWTTRAGAYNAADSIYGTRAIGAATGISAGATWQITGVQLERGSTATSFDVRPYGTELQLCQRYYWKWQPGLQDPAYSGVSSNGSSVFMNFSHPAAMRSSPTLTTSGASNVTASPTGNQFAFYVGAYRACGTTYLIRGNTLTSVVSVGSLTGVTSGQGLTLDTGADYWLSFNSEL